MNSTETYILSVIRGRSGSLASLLRLILALLAPVYCLGLKLFLLPYDLGIRKRTRLSCPVVCIGNLTTGGTGKTPMTQLLCRSLLASGKKVVVLSRGYGGENEYGCGVVSDGQRVMLNAEQAGDEAYLLAKTLPGIAVIVGKDRRVTGALAVERFQPDILVLDDGMQFWQLHRDLDIVLLNAAEPFDNGWTFPRGLLREPPSHLKRAGIIVLTNADRAGKAQTDLARLQVQKLALNRPIFRADLMPVALHSIPDGDEYPLEWLRGRSIAAFCALGNPASFEETLSTLGADLAVCTRLHDHQAVTTGDLETIFAEACAAGAEAIVTTEKDAVKLPSIPGSLPLLELRAAMKVEDENQFLAAVEAHLKPTEY